MNMDSINVNGTRVKEDGVDEEQLSLRHSGNALEMSREYKKK